MLVLGLKFGEEGNCGIASSRVLDTAVCCDFGLAHQAWFFPVIVSSASHVLALPRGRQPLLLCVLRAEI